MISGMMPPDGDGDGVVTNGATDATTVQSCAGKKRVSVYCKVFVQLKSIFGAKRMQQSFFVFCSPQIASQKFHLPDTQFFFTAPVSSCFALVASFFSGNGGGCFESSTIACFIWIVLSAAVAAIASGGKSASAKSGLVSVQSAAAATTSAGVVVVDGTAAVSV